jgi:Ferric iron reductase FhuF-like transporter
MTTLTVAVDPTAHPLKPVHDTVLGVSQGAPLVTLGDDDGAIWYPATWLADSDGPVLAAVLDVAAQRWGLGRHAAAAIAFKGYAWAATLPVIAGLLQHRRVPVLESADLRVGIADRLPYVRFDLSAVPVAVLPDDPAATGHAGALAVSDSVALLAAARTAIVGGHLAEAITAMHDATRVGTRLLWGSVAEAVAFAALQMPSDDPARAARGMLAAIGGPLAGLVEVRDEAGGPAVQRRTCCLWFTGDAGRNELCSTCCIVR